MHPGSSRHGNVNKSNSRHENQTCLKKNQQFESPQVPAAILRAEWSGCTNITESSADCIPNQMHELGTVWAPEDRTLRSPQDCTVCRQFRCYCDPWWLGPNANQSTKAWKSSPLCEISRLSWSAYVSQSHTRLRQICQGPHTVHSCPQSPQLSFTCNTWMSWKGSMENAKPCLACWCGN